MCSHICFRKVVDMRVSSNYQLHWSRYMRIIMHIIYSSSCEWGNNELLLRSGLAVASVNLIGIFLAFSLGSSVLKGAARQSYIMVAHYRYFRYFFMINLFFLEGVRIAQH